MPLLHLAMAAAVMACTVAAALPGPPASPAQAGPGPPVATPAVRGPRPTAAVGGPASGPASPFLDLATRLVPAGADPVPTTTGPVRRRSAAATSAPRSALHRTPVDPAVVVALFRDAPQPWSSGHRGVDLQVDVGAPVSATAPGVVSFSGTVVDRGVVTVTHPDGLRTSLEPVSDAPPVGTVVAAGDPVGMVSPERSHCRPVCLHWGVRRGEVYLDPLDQLRGAGPVVLLPDR